MKRTLFLALLLMAFTRVGLAQTSSFHDFTVVDIDGTLFPLSSLKGKKVLVVNVASKCGHTPQYQDLEDLYQTYKDQNFIVIGFPSDDFGNQEPGSNEEIKNFCMTHYNVTFPMMSKVKVKGEEIASVYEWLTQKSENGKEDAPVTWNFQKYMINEEGQWVGCLPPHTPPLSPLIVNWIDEIKNH